MPRTIILLVFFIINAERVMAQTCTLTSAGVAFTNFAPFGGNVDNTGTITINCSNNSPINYTLALNIGTGGGTFGTRTMNSGANTLNYNLYTNTGRTTIWGDGTGGSATVTRTGQRCRAGCANTIYGRIPGPQTSAVPGSYSSTIQATLTY